MLFADTLDVIASSPDHAVIFEKHTIKSLDNMMTMKSRITVAEINHIKRQHIMKVMLYTPTEVAVVLCCSERKIFDLIRDGKLLAACENPGRRGIRITAVSLESYLESITIDPEFWQR